MIFYFTGTGNSLYIARQIEEKPEACYRNEHISLQEIMEANSQLS